MSVETLLTDIVLARSSARRSDENLRSVGSGEGRRAPKARIRAPLTVRWQVTPVLLLTGGLIRAVACITRPNIAKSTCHTT